MAFETITLKQTVERARQAFRNELPGTDAWLWPNNVNVSAKVMGGMVHLNLLWLAYIAKQRWVSTADGEFLDKHGYVYGIPRLPASYARGQVTLDGTPSAAIPAGIGIVRSDGGLYHSISAGTVSGLGTVTLPVVAEDAGLKGNAVGGTPVSTTVAYQGLVGSGFVTSDGIGLGADEEDDESYRARLLWRLRMPPMGGAAHDYVAWAREIPGVTRVFVDPLAQGPGTVDVYFLMDELYINGIPQGSDVDAVAQHIDPLRPATAVVNVKAPIPVSVDINITGLAPDTTAVRDAVNAELADLFTREAMVSTLQSPFTLYRSKLWQAVSEASGEDHHTLAVPASDLLFNTGELPVLGTISYT